MKRWSLFAAVLVLVIGGVSYGVTATNTKELRADPLKLERLKTLNAEIELIKQTQLMPRAQEQQAIFQSICHPITDDLAKCKVEQDGRVHFEEPKAESKGEAKK